MSKLYFYTVGYDHFEECPHIALCSNKLYSEDAFKDLCATITADLYVRRRELFKERYERADKWNQEVEVEHKGASQEIISELKIDPFGRFENLYENLIMELVNEHGFEVLEYTAEFNPFGFAKIIPKDDLNGNGVTNNDDLHLIRNKIKE
jgi:hypothetical protein